MTDAGANGPSLSLRTFKHSTVGGLTLSLAYGINIEAENDPYIAMAEKAGETFTAAAEPGAFLVEVLPGLQYVPTWFPGMSWKRNVRAWRKTQEKFRELPFNATLKDMVRPIVMHRIWDSLPTEYLRYRLLELHDPRSRPSASRKSIWLRM